MGDKEGRAAQAAQCCRRKVALLTVIPLGRIQHLLRPSRETPDGATERVTGRKRAHGDTGTAAASRLERQSLRVLERYD
jgi:hypothetical protein